MPSIARETDASKFRRPPSPSRTACLETNIFPTLRSRKFDPMVRPHIESCPISFLMVKKHSTIRMRRASESVFEVERYVLTPR